MCYGTCPVYELVLRRDGTAPGMGEAFTERVGEFEGRSMRASSDAWRASSTVRGFFG